MSRLSDLVVLVIGAGSSGPGWGNGKAAAVTFARNGASTVVCADVNPAAAEATAEIIRGEGFAATAITVDVTDEDSVRAAVENTLADHGRIDVLHNNVGIAQVGGVVQTSIEEWNRVFAVNLTGAMTTMKYVLPHMAARKSGSVINVSSVAGVRWAGVPSAAYGTSKAALNYLTRMTAAEYAPHGVRVNAIVPGMMKTPMVEFNADVGTAFGASDVEDMWRRREALIPMGRMGSGWDIANAAVFLASPESGYVTGAELPVDGGLAVGGPPIG